MQQQQQQGRADPAAPRTCHVCDSKSPHRHAARLAARADDGNKSGNTSLRQPFKNTGTKTAALLFRPQISNLHVSQFWTRDLGCHELGQATDKAHHPNIESQKWNASFAMRIVTSHPSRVAMQAELFETVVTSLGLEAMRRPMGTIQLQH